MKTIRKIGKFTFFGMATLAILMMALSTQVGLSAAQAQEYIASATMCYIETSNLVTEEKKNKTIETGAVYVWRIESDNALMNGWEYTYDTIIIHKQGMGMGDRTSGFLEMYPDDYYPGGWFVEDKYNFKSQTETPEGTYTGVGDLDGVTATYVTEFLIPEQDPPVEECMYEGELPPLCNVDGELSDWCMRLPLTIQLSVTGTIED
jgi:hypothetical protein